VSNVRRRLPRVHRSEDAVRQRKSRAVKRVFGNPVAEVLVFLHAAGESGGRVGDDIRQALADVQAIQFIQNAEDCQTSAWFLSFTVSSDRDGIVTALHRQGLYLVWAWNTVPDFYRLFEGTFPFGSEGSRHLAHAVCHVGVVPRAAEIQRRLS
jgi:hypothetical protein